MFARQRALLRLIENEGGRMERLRLVKLAFLLSRDPENPRTGVYEFVPYKHGPFSFALYHDVRSLVEDGWLRENENRIETVCLTTMETAFLDAPFARRIDEASESYRNVPTHEVVDSIYASYPWFTVNAEALHKRRASRPMADCAVYTVGYEGLMVDGLLDLLMQHGVRRLIDVRCNPIARRYGFHKSTASRLCRDLDLEYIHFPSLGIPSAWRTNLSDANSYKLLFGRYVSEVLPQSSRDIDLVVELVSHQPSALMCMEADHRCCHRSHLAKEVSRRTGLAIRELRECK